MPYECPDCANVFAIKPKGGRCPECDTKLISDDDYDGPWEIASGTSEGGAAPETNPSYRQSMRDAGRGHLLGD